ncbi:MAG: hypothetical protein DI533_05490 [Cereibacter sphaeroides]|uniref:Uncharacterized protein n=1 Tax=Cereibacter sphaeroides TaxID=1063 RepID=A0A2W5SK88_CERSP|nr:MAG: hypothetical protein DI533_05490 [Cereibacter sphaeroides]
MKASPQYFFRPDPKTKPKTRTIPPLEAADNDINPGGCPLIILEASEDGKRQELWFLAEGDEKFCTYQYIGDYSP